MRASMLRLMRAAAVSTGAFGAAVPALAACRESLGASPWQQQQQQQQQHTCLALAHARSHGCARTCARARARPFAALLATFLTHLDASRCIRRARGHAHTHARTHNTPSQHTALTHARTSARTRTGNGVLAAAAARGLQTSTAPSALLVARAAAAAGWVSDSRARECVCLHSPHMPAHTQL